MPAASYHSTRQPATLADGFTLVEALVAMVLGLLALLLLVPLVGHAGDAARVLPAGADIDQRLRSVATTLEEALRRAGEGVPTGPYAGPLSDAVPVIFPHRRRVLGADHPLSAYTDRLTIWRAASARLSASLALDLMSGRAPLSLAWSPPCHADDAACRFANDSLALVHDTRGRLSLLRVAHATSSSLRHVPDDIGLPFALAHQPHVLSIVMTSFVFDRATGVLRLNTGGGDMPMLDHVVAFDVDLFGSPGPPRMPTWTTTEASCLTNADGSPRLPVLAADAGPFVRLLPSQLIDGPTCGEGAGAYDADLLRIRRVRVRIRVEAVADALRGRDRERFAHPGAGMTAAVSPDREVVIDVAPRNLQHF